MGRKNNTGGNALDQLAGKTPAEHTHTPAPASEPVWLVYQGTQGADQEFAHEGSFTSFLPSGDHESLTLYPGLNAKIDPAKWAAYKAHPPIANKLDAGQIVETDADLTGWTAREKQRRLVSQMLGCGVVDVHALEHLIELETAKPVTAGPRDRRDAQRLDRMKRALDVHSRRRPVVFDGIVPAAASMTVSVDRPR